jgi:putative DNA primase/helicase
MDFRQTLEAAGLLPKDIVADGAWHRCKTVDHLKKLNGSYKLFADGRTGLLQNHATMSEVATWRAGTDSVQPIISQAQIQAKQNEARRNLIQATQAARKFWYACKPIRFGHSYLTEKLLSMAGCDGLRIDADGWLVVPVMFDGNLISVQRIAPDGTKRFWSGASVKGGSYIIQPTRFSMTALCEGLATGLAVYQCLPDCRVIVTFDCGNMVEVSKRLSIHGLSVIAADNDHKTFEKIGKNPGIDHGTEAAKQIKCGIAWPTGINGSDFADQLKEFTLIARAANDDAPRREQLRDSELQKMVAQQIAREIKRACKFVPHKISKGAT